MEYTFQAFHCPNRTLIFFLYSQLWRARYNTLSCILSLFHSELHALPHDFRTRLNSNELRDVGKEFIKAQQKTAKISSKNQTRTHGLSPIEFEQVMQNLGFEDLPMMKRVFAIFDLDGDGEVDYHELVCCVDLLLRGHGEETLRFCLYVSPQSFVLWSCFSFFFVPHVHSLLRVFLRCVCVLFWWHFVFRGFCCSLCGGGWQCHVRHR